MGFCVLVEDGHVEDGARARGARLRRRECDRSHKAAPLQCPTRPRLGHNTLVVRDGRSRATPPAAVPTGSPPDRPVISDRRGGRRVPRGTSDARCLLRAGRTGRPSPDTDLVSSHPVQTTVLCVLSPSVSDSTPVSGDGRPPGRARGRRTCDYGPGGDSAQGPSFELWRACQRPSGHASTRNGPMSLEMVTTGECHGPALGASAHSPDSPIVR